MQTIVIEHLLILPSPLRDEYKLFAFKFNIKQLNHLNIAKSEGEGEEVGSGTWFRTLANQVWPSKGLVDTHMNNLIPSGKPKVNKFKLRDLPG